VNSSALLIVSVVTKEKHDAQAKEGREPWTLTELGGQTVWEWLKLLIAPFIIALATAGFTLVFTHQLTQQQAAEERAAEERAAQQLLEAQRLQFSLFQVYLDHIETLLLDRGLRTSKEDSNVRKVAQARTLSALDTLSPERKIWVLEFLYETKLIQFGSQGEQPVISLRFANLSETNLVKRSILSNTDLDRAELIDAKLNNAKLSNTELPLADLSGANLAGANLAGAKGVRCEQTQVAKSLDGATMPNGKYYEDWLKDRAGCGQ